MEQPGLLSAKGPQPVAIGVDWGAVDGDGYLGPLQHVRQNEPSRRIPGWMALRHRRRQRRLEVAPEVQLPNRQRLDPDGRRRRVLRRRRRQFLRARCRHRPETLGPAARWRGRRRRDYLRGERRPEDRSGGGLHKPCLANKDRYCQGQGTGRRGSIRRRKGGRNDGIGCPLDWPGRWPEIAAAVLGWGGRSASASAAIFPSARS